MTIYAGSTASQECEVHLPLSIVLVLLLQKVILLYIFNISSCMHVMYVWYVLVIRKKYWEHFRLPSPATPAVPVAMTVVVVAASGSSCDVYRSEKS